MDRGAWWLQSTGWQRIEQNFSDWVLVCEDKYDILSALGHMVKEIGKHTDSKLIHSKKARGMLGTWAKHGVAKMGGASMKLHGSIQGGYSSLLPVSGCLETLRGARTSEEMIVLVLVEKARPELGWGPRR